MQAGPTFQSQCMWQKKKRTSRQVLLKV